LEHKLLHLSHNRSKPFDIKMGRHNFAATRVRASATALMERGRLATPPPWYQVTSEIPPSQPLVRPLQPRPVRTQHKAKKPSKMFQPARIVYPEDKLRRQFFADHPWELARPRVVLENDGHDAKEWDWGRGIEQPGKPLDGERWVAAIRTSAREAN
jgi:small subunit ribosomal protein S23